MRVTCGYEPNLGRLNRDKRQFYDEMAFQWDLKNLDKFVLGQGGFDGLVGIQIDVLRECMENANLAKKMITEENDLNFVMKRS